MNPAHGERGHNIFGGSSAERNYKCPGNVALKILKNIPDSESSDAAKEGTRFHELIDICGQMASRYYNQKGKLPKLDLLLDFPTKNDWPDEMQRYARLWFQNLYREIKEKKPKKFLPELVVEQPTPIVKDGVEYYLGGPADALFAYKDEEGNAHLFIADAKYGVGYVEETSLQLLFYGGCAVAQYSGRTYESLTVAVFQPRSEDGDAEEPWRTHTYSREELYDSIVSFKRKAMESVDLIGADQKEIEEHLNAGDWCGFCPCKHVCKAWNHQANENAELDFSDIEELVVRQGNDDPTSVAQTLVPLLDTPEKLARFLHFIPFIKKIMKHAQDLAIVSILEGQEIPGWKVVEGRTQRRFLEQETIVVKGLKQLGINNPYSQKLRGIGSIESELKDLGMTGKEAKEAIKPLVSRTEPGKNLVAEEDVRQAVQLEDGASSDFAGIEIELD